MSKQQTVVFTLRDEYADGFDAATVSLRDGTPYDVKAALDAGNGKIELDPEKDEQTIATLAGFHPLEYTIDEKARPAKASTARKGDS